MVFLEKAQEEINEQIEYLFELSENYDAIIGLEPSTILGFRDEWPKLMNGKMRDQVGQVAVKFLTLDEFLYGEIERNNLSSEHFKRIDKPVHIHAHCHEKTLSDPAKSAFILSSLTNADVRYIPSGCCGMAGTFGYEKEHRDLSLKIANQVLFPYLDEVGNDDIVIMNGMSCRHQVDYGMGKKAIHIAEVLLKHWE